MNGGGGAGDAVGVVRASGRRTTRRAAPMLMRHWGDGHLVLMVVDYSSLLSYPEFCFRANGAGQAIPQALRC
jgi:hypothetical protein